MSKQTTLFLAVAALVVGGLLILLPKSTGSANHASAISIDTFGVTKAAKPMPSEQEGYPAYVQGIGQATGQIATDPNTSVDQAIKILHDTVANQVGADNVETISG